MSRDTLRKKAVEDVIELAVILFLTILGASLALVLVIAYPIGGLSILVLTGVFLIAVEARYNSLVQEVEDKRKHEEAMTQIAAEAARRSNLKLERNRGFDEHV